DIPQKKSQSETGRYCIPTRPTYPQLSTPGCKQNQGVNDFTGGRVEAHETLWITAEWSRG
ncbi:hypothetical protein, partial [Pseudomonas nicosulfuronedens]